MAAFSYGNRYNIETNIRTLYTRRQKIARLLLTFDEYIDTFVPAEARQLFREMMPYNGFTHIRASVELNQFGHHGQGMLLIRGDRKPAPPMVKGLELQPDAPSEVVGRIKTWLENGGDVPGDFGRVMRVFNYLNDNYSRATMRHYWPTIIALCGNNPATQDLVPELQNMKAPSSVKPLPAGVMQACRKTASTVSTAQLIPEDVGETEIDEVSIESRRSQLYNEPGIGAFYGLN